MENKQPFDGRTLVAIVLCVVVWWGWQKYLENKYPEVLTTKTEQKAVIQSIEKTAAEKSFKEEKLQSLPPMPVSAVEKTWIYEDENARFTVSSVGGRISEIQLKKYLGSDSKIPVELLGKMAPGNLLISTDKMPTMSQINYVLKPISNTEVEILGEHLGVIIKKTLTFLPNKYAAKAKIDLTGNTAAIGRVNIDVGEEVSSSNGAETSSFWNPSRGSGGSGVETLEYFFSHGSKANRDQVQLKDSFKSSHEQTQFASVGSRYFTTLMFNRANILPESQAIKEGGSAVLRFSYPVLDHGAPISFNLDMYSGPKLLDQLRQFDGEAISVIDYGYFSWIALPLLQIMKWFFGIFHNYGAAIIALTILVRILTFPFTYISFKSMKSMQKIQPEIARLKEIYKDNTQGLNMEMMKLMKENKVNPMGGCLPLFLQLPVFWALYQVLQNSIELYHSPFILWIYDLSQKDPYYILPILMGVTMFIQQKTTPTTMDPAQAKILLIMPIFFSFLMFSLPSGLTLYIFVSTLFGIIQQIVMMRDRKHQGQGQAVVRRA